MKTESKKRKIYITTDWHLGHDMLWQKEYRPKGFEEKIISNLGRVLTRDDVLIHLGDVFFKDNQKWESVLWTLEGRKILIRGNHDNHSYSWLLNKGFDFICDEFQLDIFGKKLLFSHRPIDLIARNVDFNIHGHSHGNAHRDEEYCNFYSDKHIEFTLEKNQFQPILLQDLIQKK